MLSARFSPSLYLCLSVSFYMSLSNSLDTLRPSFLILCACPVGCGYALPASTPQKPWPYPLPPLFGFGYKAFAAPCYLLHAHVKLQRETWGASWDHLYHHHYHCFLGDWQGTTDPHTSRCAGPGAGSSLPPHPPPTYLKGRLWRGMGRNVECRAQGIRGRGRSPTPRRSPQCT